MLEREVMRLLYYSIYPPEALETPAVAVQWFFVCQESKPRALALFSGSSPFHGVGANECQTGVSE